MVGVHEKIMQTTKASKGNASIYLFFCNGRLRNCRQIMSANLVLQFIRKR